MEWIKDWLLGVACAAMIVTLAQRLTPAGAAGKIGRLTGGLVLLLAAVQPVLRVDPAAILDAAAGYGQAWSAQAPASLEETTGQLLKTIIAQRTGAYIVDKAAGLGAACQVEVTVGEQTGDGYPLPESVVITGALTADQQAALTQQIAAELDIPADRQIYERGDGA